MLILGHTIADRHMPGHDLGIGDAFANVGQLEVKSCHYAASITRRSAARTRCGPGK